MFPSAHKSSQCPLRVNLTVLTFCPSSPLYPEHRTFPDAVGTSHLCQQQTLPDPVGSSHLCDLGRGAFAAQGLSGTAPVPLSSRPSVGSTRQRRQRGSPPVCAAHGPRELPSFSAQIVRGFGRVDNESVEQGAGKPAGWPLPLDGSSIGPRAEANWRHSSLDDTRHDAAAIARYSSAKA
jgi:hypothetical protein